MRPARILTAAVVLTGVAVAGLAGHPALDGRFGLRLDPGAAADEGAGDARKGKAVYEANCVPCHRKDGTPGRRVVSTANPPPSFTSPDFWRSRSDAQIRKVIEVGVPKTGMEPWKGVLKPQQIRDVVSYLRAQFQPREAKDRP
jgi:mono/diheme cytochrome c family protein